MISISDILNAINENVSVGLFNLIAPYLQSPPKKTKRLFEMLSEWEEEIRADERLKIKTYDKKGKQ